MKLLDALVEQRIAAAAARGEFDDLPGAGVPQEFDDDLLVPEEVRVANRILKNAGFVPPAVEQLRSLRHLRDELDATGEHARLRVIDDGPGVPDAERERIFGRFERGGQAGAGFGLGLAIARGLARQMGGDVNAPAVPSGACFEVTLAACAAPVGAAQTTHQITDTAPVSAATTA